MSKEAMKLALWTLEGWANYDDWVWPESALEQSKRNTIEAIAALRQALETEKQWVGLTKEDMPDGDNPMFDTNEFYAGMSAWHGWVLREVLFDNGEPIGHREPEQEPVAWMCKRDDGHFDVLTDQTCKKCFPVYTAPQKREWVGLTEREVELIDEMIETQLLHAERCDHMANSTMAQKQKAWDLERVELLRKLKEKNT